MLIYGGYSVSYSRIFKNKFVTLWLKVVSALTVLSMVLPLFYNVAAAASMSVDGKGFGSSAPTVEENAAPMPFDATGFTIPQAPASPRVESASLSPENSTAFSPSKTPSPSVVTAFKPSLDIWTDSLSVTLSEEFELFWSINRKEDIAIAQGSHLEIVVPEGLTPLGKFDGLFDKRTHTLSIQLDLLDDKGNVRWQIAETTKMPFEIQVSLYDAKELIDYKTLFMNEDVRHSISKDGGEAVSENGRIKVKFPAGASNEALEVLIWQAKDDRYIPKLSGNAFDISARGSDTKEDIHTFGEEVTIEVA